jgi:hypothetical protein
MDGVIVIAAVILNPLARKRRQQAEIIPSDEQREMTITSTLSCDLKSPDTSVANQIDGRQAH